MMELLNTIEIASDKNFADSRFPVQYVNRPNLDFRGFCGTIASGIFHKGDPITVLPSGKTSAIKSIVTYDGDLDEVFAPMAITLTLEDEIDISRGDMITASNASLPIVSDQFKADIVWMTEKAMIPGRQYTIKLATRSVSGSVSTIHYRIDVNTLDHHDADELNLNEIASCTVSVNAPVVFDPYKQNKGTGAFIIIDRLTNVTVGAGMITGTADDNALTQVTAEERAARFNQKPAAIALSGTRAAERAYQLERKLFDTGHATTVLENQDSHLDILLPAIKKAGLISICVTQASEKVEFTFDTDQLDLDAIYNALKDNDII